MLFYNGFKVFRDKIKQTDGQDAIAIAITIANEQGQQDAMIVSCHPDDVEYILKALRALSRVKRGMLSEAMVREATGSRIITLGNNGMIKK